MLQIFFSGVAKLLQLIFKNMVLVWGRDDKVGVPTSRT